MGDEARRRAAGFIGPEHLLFGLAGESEGIAGGVLRSLEVSADSVRGQIELLLGRQPPPDAPPSGEGTS